MMTLLIIIAIQLFFVLYFFLGHVFAHFTNFVNEKILEKCVGLRLLDGYNEALFHIFDRENSFRIKIASASA